MLLVAAVVLATGAGATAPPGFRESASLTPRAKLVSGSRAAVVYCARTDAAWSRFIQATQPDEIADQIAALVLGDAAFMTRQICRPLELRLRGSSVNR